MDFFVLLIACTADLAEVSNRLLFQKPIQKNRFIVIEDGRFSTDSKDVNVGAISFRLLDPTQSKHLLVLPYVSRNDHGNWQMIHGHQIAASINRKNQLGIAYLDDSGALSFIETSLDSASIDRDESVKEFRLKHANLAGQQVASTARPMDYHHVTSYYDERPISPDEWIDDIRGNGVGSAISKASMHSIEADGDAWVIKLCVNSNLDNQKRFRLVRSFLGNAWRRETFYDQYALLFGPFVLIALMASAWAKRTYVLKRWRSMTLNRF